jgi:hypothetical protein
VPTPVYVYADGRVVAEETGLKAKRDLTAKEKARVKSLDAEINSLEKNIPLGKKVKAAAEAQARNANSVTSAAAPPSGKRLELEVALPTIAARSARPSIKSLPISAILCADTTWTDEGVGP